MSRPSTIPDTAIVAIAPEVLGSDLGTEVVILSLRDGTYYGLEETGAEIWRLIQSPIAIDQIVTSLVDTYDVDAERCRADVMALVATLVERGLVEVHDRT